MNAGLLSLLILLALAPYRAPSLHPTPYPHTVRLSAHVEALLPTPFFYLSQQVLRHWMVGELCGFPRFNHRLRLVTSGRRFGCGVPLDR